MHHPPFSSNYSNDQQTPAGVMFEGKESRQILPTNELSFFVQAENFFGSLFGFAVHREQFIPPPPALPKFGWKLFKAKSWLGLYFVLAMGKVYVPETRYTIIMGTVLVCFAQNLFIAVIFDDLFKSSF